MSALFSDDRVYRHMLVVKGANYCGWICCNPSRANGEDITDPSLQKMRGFSRDWGYDGLVLVNCYDMVATDPNDLWKPGARPLSAVNDTYIAAVAMLPLVVVGWGSNVKPSREDEVLKILEDARCDPYCLRVNANGSPGHPLYIPYSQKLQRYRP